MRRVDINTTVIQAMAEVLQPQLDDLANKAMDALQKRIAEEEDPLLDLTVGLAAGWVREHGSEKAFLLIQKLRTGLRDPKQLAELEDSLTAEQLTELVDTYQNAEAAQQKNTKRTMQKVGAVVGEITRYAGQAFLATLVA